MDRFSRRFLAFLVVGPTLAGCVDEAEVAYFCPEDPCDVALIREMDGASSTLDVAIYSLTLEEIIDALGGAARRGVAVRVLAEADQNAPELATSLTRLGVNFRWDSNPDAMHNKFTVVDGSVVLTGSYNYSANATYRNNENLLLLANEGLAQRYSAQFELLFSEGVAP